MTSGEITCHKCSRTVISPNRPVEPELIPLYDNLTIKEHLVFCATVWFYYNGNLYAEWDPDHCDVATLVDGNLSVIFQPLLQNSNNEYIDDQVVLYTWPGHYSIKRAHGRIHHPRIFSAWHACRNLLSEMHALKNSWGFP